MLNSLVSLQKLQLIRWQRKQAWNTVCEWTPAQGLHVSWYLRELMQHTGQLTGVRALSVVLLSPPSGPVAAPPRLLLPLAWVVRSAARRVGGRAKGGGGTGQEGQDSG